jgi:hypothetical protein
LDSCVGARDHSQWCIRYNARNEHIDSIRLQRSFPHKMPYMLALLVRLDYRPTGRRSQYRYALWDWA